jgi:hypothetical protein
MNQQQIPGQSSFGLLRDFVRKRAPGERCELCSAEIGTEHAHLLEPQSRQLLCACEPCSILFDGRQNGKFRRVPRRIQSLANFRLSDEQWASLYLPIGLAFFFQSTPARRVVAMYPSPAGATESLLTLEPWKELAVENPILDELEPDVEALLVNRVAETKVYFRVPIDECYKLVGLIRKHWRGLGGGSQVWEAIEQFFVSLNARSFPEGEQVRA